MPRSIIKTLLWIERDGKLRSSPPEEPPIWLRALTDYMVAGRVYARSADSPHVSAVVVELGHPEPDARHREAVVARMLREWNRQKGDRDAP